MQKELKPILVNTLLLGLISICIFLFGFFPNLVLKHYSTGIYPYISIGLRFLSSIFPFALGDIIYALLTGFVLYKIIRFYRRRKHLKKIHRIAVPLQILNFFLILYLVFKIVWGLNYSRPSVAKELSINDEKYTLKELILLGDYFVNKTNRLKTACLTLGKMPTDPLEQLKNKAIEAYKKQQQTNPLFEYRIPSVKPVSNAYIISKIGIEGYYNPLSGEANINTNLPDFVKPYVTCHEIAHQLGIAYEDEANLLGYLTAGQSNDVYFQYSAHYEMLRYILFEIALKSLDDYKLLKAKLNQQVLNDFKTEKEFWRKYNGEMFKYMDATFDRFLKLNNQKKGINSYQDIVIWLYNYHKSKILSKALKDY